MYYVMLVFSALLLAVSFAFNKLYQKINGASVYAAFFFNTLLGLAEFLFFFAINGFRIEFRLYSCIMIGISGLLIVCYNVFGFKILKLSGSVSLYTISLMTGGMVLPYIWGIAFLNESFTYIRTIGFLMIITGVVLSNFGTGKVNAKQLLMCGAVFFLNGCVSIVSKMHQIQTFYKTVGETDFIILDGMFKFLISGVIFLVIKNKYKNTEENLCLNSNTKIIPIIAAAAIVGGLAFMLQLKGASNLPATVIYPFVTGGSIVFSAIIGRIVFKEKISFKLALSIALCFAGTIFFV